MYHHFSHRSRWRSESRFESEEAYKMFIIFSLCFITLHHESLFGSYYLYCYTVSNDIVILIGWLFCDIISLSIITCLQRNIPWMSLSKTFDEKLSSYKLDLVSDLKKKIMREVKTILSEKD